MSGGGSRLGAAVASLGVGALPAVGGGGHAAPPRPQFAPRVPADRPRSKAPPGQAGPSVPSGTPAGLEPQFAALLARTVEDSARLDARRSGGRQGQAAAPSTLRKAAAQDGAAGAPAVAFGPTPPAPAAASKPPPRGVKDDHADAGPAAAAARAPDAPPGETPKRKSRTPAKDRGGQATPGAPPRGGGALAPHPVDEDADSSDDGESMEVDGAGPAAPPGMPAWADHSREYPITLPFPEPAAVDLADLAHQQDGRLFLMQLPVRAAACDQWGIPLTDLLHTSSPPQALLPMTPPSAHGTAVGLESLSDGCLGQLVLYKSGAVKLRCGGGDVLFDVLPGAPLSHCEQLAAVNPGQGRVAFLGTARARYVVSPDIETLLASTAVHDTDGMRRWE